MITNLIQFKNRPFYHDGSAIRSTFGIEASGLADANYCDFTIANGKLFAATGYQSSNTVRVTDGPAFRETTAETAEGFKLKCAALAEHKGILYAANLQETDGTYINRVRWSAFNEPENFDPWTEIGSPRNFLNFCDIGDPGEPIFRLVSFGNDLVIFKRSTIWIASGVASNERGDIAPANVRCINAKIGVVGPRAVGIHSEMLYFFSDQGLWIITPDYQFKKADNDIWQQFQDMPRQYWSNANVEVDNSTGTVYLGVPNRSVEINEWYIQNYTKKWTRWKFGMNMCICKAYSDQKGEYHVYFGGYWKGLYEVKENARNDINSATLLNTERIDPVYETGWIDLNKTTALRSMEVLIKQDANNADNVLKLDVYHDMGLVPFETVEINNSNMIDATLDSDKLLDVNFSTASQEHFYSSPIRLTGHARKVKFRFRTEGYYGKFKIIQIKLGTQGRSGI